MAFGGPTGYVAPETWIAKVGAFVDEFSPVNAWSPVNEPNHNPGGVPNWLATTPRNRARPRPTATASGAARYSRALGGFLAIRHPDDLLPSPDLHDDYDGDLADGMHARTASPTTADLHRRRLFALIRAAGGELARPRGIPTAASTGAT